MMNLFTITYPISIFILLFGLVVGFIISFFVFGLFSAVCVLFLLCIGSLRIMPVIDIVCSFLQSMFPTRIETLVQNLRKSFPVMYSEKGRPSSPCIYLFHPHGLFTISHYLHIGTHATDWEDTNSKGTALHLLWWLPFGKEILEARRFVPSHYADMKRVLDHQQSLSVTLGGVREMPMTCDNKMILNIGKKRGIFKMALETGAPLVPVIVYGENEIYQQSENWLLHRINQFLLRYNIYVPIPKWKSCRSWLSLFQRPLEHPVRTYVGPSIAVTKKEIPTEEDIIALREQYFSELRGLYEATRPSSYDKELYIV